MDKKEVIDFFLKEGYLLSPDFVRSIPMEFNKNNFLDLVTNKITSKDKPTILNKDLLLLLSKNAKTLDINWLEFEKSKALLEKGKDGKVYHVFLDILGYDVFDEKKEKLNTILQEIKEPEETSVVLNNETSDAPNVTVLEGYEEDEIKKRKVQDFVSYFRVRYDSLKRILQTRIELQNVISINRILSKRDRESVALIGIVNDKRTTKNGNILLTLEDLSGSILVLINKNRADLFDFARDLVLDEVIGVSGIVGDKIIFANNILLPDIPISKELKKSPDDAHMAFISDLHIGSKNFLLDEFNRFIKWINGDVGDKRQRDMASKIKYLFVVGDLVDGVGIFPNQDKELIIKDIYCQYLKCAELLSKIRKDIRIIICPGNHDALRIAEPQPLLHKEIAKPLWGLPNVMMVNNPCLVNVHSSENFPGFDILLYHGYSFHYYIDNVDSLRLNKARDNPHFVLKFLLQRRHLAPTHASTLYIPCTDRDPLVIDKVPDFFIAAEMHRSDVSIYNNITTINCSCWLSKTDYQEKTGNNPDPAKVPIVNLKTREVKILKFGK